MKVTYADNTSEKVEIVSMPCPVFARGETMVMQRGAGICTVKSTPEKEKACITFLKWLTEAQKNVEFVTSLGYMPVKQEAFDIYLPETIEKLSDPMYVSLVSGFFKDAGELYILYCSAIGFLSGSGNKVRRTYQANIGSKAVGVAGRPGKYG